MKHNKSVEILSIFRVSCPRTNPNPPPQKRKFPLLKTFWRRFCMQLQWIFRLFSLEASCLTWSSGKQVVLFLLVSVERWTALKDTRKKPLLQCNVFVVLARNNTDWRQFRKNVSAAGRCEHGGLHTESFILHLNKLRFHSAALGQNWHLCLSYHGFENIITFETRCKCYFFIARVFFVYISLWLSGNQCTD